MKAIIKNTAVPALAILLQVSLGTTAVADQVIWERGNPQRGVSAPFDHGSRIASNPNNREGRFRFDLEIMQTVVHQGSSFNLRLAVNSRDGSMALYNPVEFIRQWDESLLEAFRPDFIFLHTDGSGMVCGEHVEYGHINIAVEEMISLNQDDWIISPSNIVRVPADAESFPSDHRELRYLKEFYNRRSLTQMRSTLINGHTVTFWHDDSLSPVATRAPWLGLGVGLYKDPRTRVNRVAVHVRYGGYDDLPSTVFELQHIHRKNQEFDTEGYKLVTGFMFSALEELNEKMADIRRMAGQIEHLQRVRRSMNPDGADVPSVWNAPATDGIDRMIEQLERAGKADMQEFIQRHGLDNVGFRVE